MPDINTWVSLVILELMGLIIFGTAAVGAISGSEQNASKGLKFMYNAFSAIGGLCAGALLATIALGFFWFVIS